MGQREHSDLADGEWKGWESPLEELHHREEGELEGNP